MFYLLLISASVVTSLDTRHQNSCFHKAQIKVTGKGRNAPVNAPVGIYYSIIVTTYKLSHIDFFFDFLRHFLSVPMLLLLLCFFVLLLLLSPYLLHLLPHSYMFSRSSLVNCELVNLISDLELSRASLSCLF